MGLSVIFVLAACALVVCLAAVEVYAQGTRSRRTLNDDEREDYWPFRNRGDERY